MAAKAGHDETSVGRVLPAFMALVYRTTPEVNPGLRRGGLMSFFRKQCAALPA